ncbi:MULTISPECIES: S9 family peptidase [Leeuwenhoekiella]|uniref:S9 family peptidase n=1 Tax=Leeuwenhoekiella TaxID=283735 RepID=UPI000C55FDFE|nr:MULTISPECIES: prolyl oligopeptidase family serine peptidase [Leeuwenhoekiella]MAO44445.1 S9 family peptidase [Leeuwenhoekiella sp.]HBT10116.1 S9 family peptidase [Leeuwenhoekiella sp.]|tara:strand:+ start:434 stop:2884 length:2451 start_codon:yes stop_codon:yes gene_type:complete
MKRINLLSLFLLLTASVVAQVNLDYQKPPQEILDLVDVPRAPWVLMNTEGDTMLLMYRDSYKTIAGLSEEELRLGGLRINPKTNIGSRTTFYKNIKIKGIEETEAREINGLPEDAQLSNFNWSPDESKMAFTNTIENGVQVWILDLETATAKRVTEAFVNANMGNPISWFKDGKSLLVNMLPATRKELINTAEAVPTGPTISTSDGSKAQNRTYQDLLQNPNDVFNFEQLATSALVKVNLDGTSTLWKDAAMYSDVSFSPDGTYIMTSTIHKPFSYIVPYYRFPETVTVYDQDGTEVKVVNETPLLEELPQGFMATQTGKRRISWRADQPATLYWVEALDQGDPEVQVDYRDQVFMQKAPFTGAAQKVIKTINRFSGITWGDSTTAVAYDRWWNTRNTKTYVFNPSDGSSTGEVISDRSYQDTYSDPGNFVTQDNEYGRSVLTLVDGHAYLMGDGFSDKGQFPFIDKINLATQETERIYESAYTDKLEDLQKVLDIESGNVLVRIEAPTEYPNYYIRNLNDNSLDQITAFENPFKSIQDVHKELITYKREDGLELSGTLYLPVGYDMEKKEKKPMLLWAYPREYKDKNSASQTTTNPNEFTYPYYGSMVYWVTRGYVVLDDAAFPIVGEGDEEPNDTFRSQLVANAKAAIDAVDALGYIDRDRVAVGGHSYGAFMTANLLSHSNLFAAGIARSGAYNRTLTPFGFQSEERSYWEAPEIYYEMSPFMHADKMKTPLLLIHGVADNNSGTYPLQSERYFNALKGLGATARLVMLPKESHGYAAKESILHMLWEQDQWLEKYVKNRDVQEIKKQEEVKQ